VSALGTKYRVSSYSNDTFDDPRGPTYGSMFGIDETLVKTFDRNGIPVVNVALSKGELYQKLRSDSPGSPVFTAWSVETSKPAALFSGNSCTIVGADGKYCDILYEQMIPEDDLASEYVVCPTLTRPINCSESETKMILSRSWQLRTIPLLIFFQLRCKILLS
jgi:hypothetical protein